MQAHVMKHAQNKKCCTYLAGMFHDYSGLPILRQNSYKYFSRALLNHFDWLGKRVWICK
jgi:hypothetical protein